MPKRVGKMKPLRLKKFSTGLHVKTLNKGGHRMYGLGSGVRTKRYKTRKP